MPGAGRWWVAAFVAVAVTVAVLVWCRGVLDQRSTPLVEQDPGPAPTSSAMPSPRPVPSRPPAVELLLGADLQSTIDKHPAGTRYRLAAGIHREQELAPKSGDVIEGAPGAVLSGARDISAGAVRWRRRERLWVLDGQTQESTPFGTIVDGGNGLHAQPEELFVNGRRWEPVASAAELEGGRWLFDRSANRIWLARDPASLGLIETSVSSAAISNEHADDVTVIGVTVEKYANRSSFGAIDGLNALGWQIRDCTARDNHGAGVSVGPGGLVEGCDVHHNGQLGLKVVGISRRGADEGRAAAVAVRHNRVHHNRTLDFDHAWEAGGLKIAECRQGVLFADNWVHDNVGPGVWFDVYNHQATVRDNLVEDNSIRGIFYELSYGPTRIVGNVVRGNGDPTEDTPWQAGIFVSSSRDVAVIGNTVYDNVGGGIVARTAGDRDPLLRNLVVRGNHVAFTAGFVGVVADRHAPDETFTSFGNEFERNTYWTSTSGRFAWGGSERLSWAQWRAAGNDRRGTLRSTGQPASPELGLAELGYGPEQE